MVNSQLIMIKTTITLENVSVSIETETLNYIEILNKLTDAFVKLNFDRDSVIMALEDLLNY